MSSEVVQAEQRRANLEAITRLGFAAYPNKFDTTHAVSQLVDLYSASPAADLDASRVETVTAGRIVSVRNFGKASFLVLSDGRSRIQVYVRQDALSERDYQLSKLLDLGDQIGVSGHLFRTKTNELSIWASALQFLAKCFLPLPEKWHGLQDVEITVPPALSRPGRQSRRQARVRDAHRDGVGDSGFPESTRLPRSGNADDAADRGRRAGPAFRDASQRARHEALPAHRAGAVSQAAHRRRDGARIRDQPQLPQ